MPRGFVHRRFLHYYLLAATGACIGFAINKTDEAVASWQQIPWGVAVICWALSLYFGSRILIKETEYMAHVARVDMALKGDDPNVQPDPQVTQQLLQWAQQKGPVEAVAIHFVACWRRLLHHLARARNVYAGR